MADFRFATSIHILLALANSARQAPNALVSSAQLAESTQSNPALIRQLLVPLTEAGLIEAFRGKRGGIKLAKPANQITLKQIYEASYDSPLMLCRREVNQKCPIGSNIQSIFKRVMDDLESALLKNLKGKSLENLLSIVDANPNFRPSNLV